MNNAMWISNDLFAPYILMHDNMGLLHVNNNQISIQAYVIEYKIAQKSKCLVKTD